MIVSILSVIADAVISTFFEKVADNLYDRLKTPASKKAFEEAIGNAIKRYAVGPRIALAEPLLQAPSFLSQPEVAHELAKVVLFQEQPNVQVIARYWARASKPVLSQRNFEEDVVLWLQIFEEELRRSGVFQEVFASKDLNKISSDIDMSRDRLIHIEQQMNLLTDFIKSRYGALQGQFYQVSDLVAAKIYDFSYYIREKTNEFVGREHVMKRIRQFIAEHDQGYCIISGDPGIGKSAIAAKFVQEQGCPHHFNIRADGINSTKDFLKNICAQLVAIYRLDHSFLLDENGLNGNVLINVLHQVSDNLSGNKCVIVVDALDEVNEFDKTKEANILNLPRMLPKGIFFVVTMRREDINLRIEIREQLHLPLEQDDKNNLKDVRTYIKSHLSRDGIAKFIGKQHLSPTAFINLMASKSQGNFIYLSLVLHEIEAGAYTDINYQQLPAGLASYYEDHWKRIRGLDEQSWFTYRLPVVIALTVVKEPVSAEQIALFAQIGSVPRVLDVIGEFNQFIYSREVDDIGRKKKLYRWYHASFFEFVSAKEAVQEEKINLIEANSAIVDIIWKNLNIDQLMSDDSSY